MSYNTALGAISYEDFETQLRELVSPSKTDPSYLQTIAKQIKVVITPKKTKKTAEQNTSGLVLICRSAKEAQSEHVRQISYVLLSQVLKNSWSIIQEDFKTELKRLLLETAVTEPSALVRHSVGGMIARIVTKELGSSRIPLMQKWPGLMTWLNTLLFKVGETDLNRLAIGISILAEIPNAYVSIDALHQPTPNVVAWSTISKDKKLKRAALANTSQLTALAPLLSAILEKQVGIVNPGSPCAYPLEITVEAIKLLNAIYNLAPAKNYPAIIESFMIPVAETLKKLLLAIHTETRSGNHAKQGLTSSQIANMNNSADAIFRFYIDVFNNYTVDFTKESFANFLKYFLEIAPYAKHQSLNIILTLIYSYLKFFKMDTDSDTLTNFLLEQLFMLLVGIDEDSGDDEELEAKSMILNIFETLAIELAPKLIIDPINMLVQRCQTESNLQHIKACMNILGSVAEGCSEYMKGFAELYMSFLLKGLHAGGAPIIITASLDCLALLAIYLSNELKSFHFDHISNTLLDLVLKLAPRPMGATVDDDDEKKYISSVLCAFDAYYELFSEDEITSRLHVIVPKLCEAANPQYLSCLGTIISVSKAGFKPYVSRTWDLLHNVIQINIRGFNEKKAASSASPSNPAAETAAGEDKSDTYLLFISTSLYTLSCLLKTELEDLRNPDFIRSIIHEIVMCFATEDNEVIQNGIEVFGALAKLLKEDFAAIQGEIVPFLRSVLDEENYSSKMKNATGFNDEEDGHDSSEDLEDGGAHEDIFGEDDEDAEGGYNDAIVEKKCRAIEAMGSIAEFAPMFSVENLVSNTWDNIFTEGLLYGPLEIKKASIATITQYCLALSHAQRAEYLPRFLNDFVIQLCLIIEEEVDTLLLIHSIQALETLSDNLGSIVYEANLKEVVEKIMMIIQGKTSAQLVRIEDNAVNEFSYGEYDQLLVESAISFFSVIAKAIGLAYDQDLLPLFIGVANDMFSTKTVKNADCIIVGVFAEILDAIVGDLSLLKYSEPGSVNVAMSTSHAHEDTVLSLSHKLAFAIFGPDGTSTLVQDEDTLANTLYMLGLTFVYAKHSLVVGNASSKALPFLMHVATWIYNLLPSQRVQNNSLFHDNILGCLSRIIACFIVYYECEYSIPHIKEITAKFSDLYALLFKNLPVRSELIENIPITDMLILSAAKNVKEIASFKAHAHTYLLSVKSLPDFSLSEERLNKLNLALAYYGA